MLKKNYLIATIIITAVIASAADAREIRSLLNNIDERFDRMNRKIDEIRGGIDAMFANDLFDDTKMNGKDDNDRQLTVDDKGDTVVIKLVVGADITKIGASVEATKLSIELQEKNQRVHVHYDKTNNFLSIATNMSEEKEEKKDSTEKKWAFARSMKHGQTLKDQINLDKAKVTYENETLTISIPKITKKKTTPKKIEVTIK